MRPCPGPGRGDHGAGHSLACMRAVQITRFGGPEVLEIVDVPEPTPGPGQQLYDVSTAGINFADTHQSLPESYLSLGLMRPDAVGSARTRRPEVRS